MRQTLIVTSSNRAMDRETYDSIAALKKLGVRHVNQTGSADVAFARNQALSWACAAIKSERQKADPISSVLMIDDDMVFDVEAAKTLVTASRARGVACSASYVTINSIPAAQLLKTAEDGKNLWCVGLGLLAIPADLLLWLEARSKPFTYRKTRKADPETFREFCRSGERDGEWLSEDFSLCERLGGVHLLPVDAGHRKLVTLYSPDSWLKELADADR